MELHVHGGQPVMYKGILFVTLGLCQNLKKYHWNALVQHMVLADYG